MANDTTKVSLQALDKEVYNTLKLLAQKQNRTMKATAELLITQAADIAGIKTY